MLYALGSFWQLIVAAFIILILCRAAFMDSLYRRKIGHWHGWVDHMNFSSASFYTSLKERIEEKQIENLGMFEMALGQYSSISSKRNYLVVNWNQFKFYVCAAPFGSGFFFSWWMVRPTMFLHAVCLAIPYVGKPLSTLFFPKTFFKDDTLTMYKSMIHACMMEVVEEFTKAQGVRGLRDEQQLLSMEPSIEQV